MSSCCWRSASTPGRDGSSEGTGPDPTHASEPQMHSVGQDRLVVRRPPRPRVGDVVRARATEARRPGAGRRPHRPRRHRARSPVAGWRRTSTRSRRRCTSSSGELLVDLGGRVHRLVDGDFALIPTGLRHALGNTGVGGGALPVAQQPATARSVGTRGATRSSSRRRTSPRMDADAMRPPFGDPTLRLVGHYEGTGPQIEALRVKDAGARPRSGRARTPRSSPTAGSP